MGFFQARVLKWAYVGENTLIAESEGDLKSLLMKVKEEREKKSNQEHRLWHHGDLSFLPVSAILKL